MKALLFQQREWKYYELSELEECKVSLLVEQLGISQVAGTAKRAFTMRVVTQSRSGIDSILSGPQGLHMVK